MHGRGMPVVSAEFVVGVAGKDLAGQCEQLGFVQANPHGADFFPRSPKIGRPVRFLMPVWTG